MPSFGGLFVVNMNDMLNKQSSCLYFYTSYHAGDATILLDVRVPFSHTELAEHDSLGDIIENEYGFSTKVNNKWIDILILLFLYFKKNLTMAW